ncbi:MAG: cytochrome P450 [Roseiflexaceae bacterium]
MTDTPKLAAYNPLDPAAVANPYAVYARYRSVSPIHRSVTGPWYVFSHALCTDILRDPRFTSDPRRARGEQTPAPRHAAYIHYEYENMLRRDAPDHTRLRNLIGRAFTVRMTEGMRPRIAAITDQLIDDVLPQGGMDLITDLALPLPMLVISELLGVPTTDRQLLKRWSKGLFEALDAYMPEDEDGVLTRAAQAASEFGAYLRDLIALRRSTPGSDLFSELVRLEEQGDRLSESELVSMAMLLLSAGHETTTNLIGNGVLALLEHTDQLATLRYAPDLIDSAVEEILRFDSPVQLFARWALEDLTVAGQAIQRGQMIALVIGSANRDPAAFIDPDHFDITRSERRALSFGQGPHYCLGAPLARVQGQVAIAKLLKRIPNLAAPHPPNWNGSPVFRGLKTLPLVW